MNHSPGPTLATAAHEQGCLDVNATATSQIPSVRGFFSRIFSSPGTSARAAERGKEHRSRLTLLHGFPHSGSLRQRSVNQMDHNFCAQLRGLVPVATAMYCKVQVRVVLDESTERILRIANQTNENSQLEDSRSACLQRLVARRINKLHRVRCNATDCHKCMHRGRLSL